MGVRAPSQARLPRCPLGFRVLGGYEGVEKKMEIITTDYIGATIRIHSLIPSEPTASPGNVNVGTVHGWRCPNLDRTK